VVMDKISHHSRKNGIKKKDAHKKILNTSTPCYNWSP
jgi:hypothetical protein